MARGAHPWRHFTDVRPLARSRRAARWSRVAPRLVVAEGKSAGRMSYALRAGVPPNLTEVYTTIAGSLRATMAAPIAWCCARGRGSLTQPFVHRPAVRAARARTCSMSRAAEGRYLSPRESFASVAVVPRIGRAGGSCLQLEDRSHRSGERAAGHDCPSRSARGSPRRGRRLVRRRRRGGRERVPGRERRDRAPRQRSTAGSRTRHGLRANAARGRAPRSRRDGEDLRVPGGALPGRHDPDRRRARRGRRDLLCHRARISGRLARFRARRPGPAAPPATATALEARGPHAIDRRDRRRRDPRHEDPAARLRRGGRHRLRRPHLARRERAPRAVQARPTRRHVHHPVRARSPPIAKTR